jgi:hypothetical protein
MQYSCSIQNPLLSDKTIAQLVEKGYIGVSFETSMNTVFAAAAYKFNDKIKWAKTRPDQDGDVGLMTPDTVEFGNLLQFMLDNFGWCPMVYSNQEEEKTYIFAPQNELEEAAIELVTEGDRGWKGSLYSLGFSEKERDRVCFIFSTKPKESTEQEWLLYVANLKDHTSYWSYHDGSIQEVYYKWAEEIEGDTPNYNPTSDEILDALGKGTNVIQNDIKGQDRPKIIQEIRERIKKELNGKNVPRKNTIEQWLDKHGTEGIENRIQKHFNYWKSRTNSDLSKSEIIEHASNEKHGSKILTDVEKVLEGRKLLRNFAIPQRFLKDLECSVHLFIGQEYSDCIFDVYIINGEESLGYKNIDKIKKSIQQIILEGKAEEVVNISIKWYKCISAIFPSLTEKKIDELKYLVTTPFLKDSNCVSMSDREFLVNSCSSNTDNWFQIARLSLISMLSLGSLE